MQIIYSWYANLFPWLFSAKPTTHNFYYEAKFLLIVIYSIDFNFRIFN